MFTRRTSVFFNVIRRASTQQIQFIGCANGVGGRELGGEHAVHVIKKSTFLKKWHIPYRWVAMVQEAATSRHLKAIPEIRKVSEQVAFAVRQWVLLRQNPVVIGGDHSCAIGTWSGLASALRHDGDMGLIWVDAHLDAHTPASSDTGNVHGMPVAHLLGYGDKRLTSISDDKPKLLPKNLVYIGARSFEAPEKQLMDDLGVRMFMQPEIDKLGIEKVLNEAIKQVSKETVGFGMSIDMDGFRVIDAPGVGTPVEGGVIAEQFIDAISRAHLKKLLVTEMVEFLPRFDRDKRTEKLLLRLIEAIYDNKFKHRADEDNMDKLF